MQAWLYQLLLSNWRVRRRALGSYDFARSRLAGVNIGLRGLALGGSRGLLAIERFLFHSHCSLAPGFDLSALRNTRVQAEGQTPHHRPPIVKHPNNEAGR